MSRAIFPHCCPGIERAILQTANIGRALVRGRGCERFECFGRFSSSRIPAKLPGCMPENLFSPNSQFRRCVRRYRGEHKVKTFSCWNQFLCMAFGQLTFRGESARGGHFACAPASASSITWGFTPRFPAASWPTPTANATGASTTIWPNCSFGARPRALRGGVLGGDLKAAVYALDSTTIDLCLSLFPGRFRRTKAAIKLDTLLDLRGLSRVHRDFTGQTGRRARAGRIDLRAGFLLRDGSRC